MFRDFRQTAYSAVSEIGNFAGLYAICNFIENTKNPVFTGWGINY